MGAREDIAGAEALSVERLATPEEIRGAVAQAAADLSAWLDMARGSAGLPDGSRRRRAPEGYPEIPPADGIACSAEDADSYGRVWWRAFKSARDEVEATTFESIARSWFHRRDQLRGR
jgi:hypothetical protein